MEAQLLPSAMLGLLRQLALQSWSHDFYLAGSAALAMHLAHRKPYGLDLMSRSVRLVSPERRDLMGALADAGMKAEVETARDGFLDLRFTDEQGFADGTPVRLYYYPYSLVEPAVEVDGMAIASAIDLALMKLGAIISRGARRDFVDLFLLCQGQPLESVLEVSHEKFPKVRDFPLQALKGLSDYEILASEPMPKLEIPLRWATIESWLTGEVRQLARQQLGLRRPSEDHA